MKTKRKILGLIVATVMLIEICGCGNSNTGKVKDGVYTNSTYGFKITPDDDMIYLEDATDSLDYAVAYSYCVLMGGKDSFNVEYALNNQSGGLMVVTEDNVGGYSNDDFVASIESQLKEKIFFTYKTEYNKDVTIGNTTFRKLVIDSQDNHQTFLVKTTESRIMFIYIAVTRNGVKNGLEEQYLNAITGL